MINGSATSSDPGHPEFLLLWSACILFSKGILFLLQSSCYLSARSSPPPRPPITILKIAGVLVQVSAHRCWCCLGLGGSRMKKEGNRILAPNIFPFSKWTKTQMLFQLMLYKHVILSICAVHPHKPKSIQDGSPVEEKCGVYNKSSRAKCCTQGWVMYRAAASDYEDWFT